MKYFIGIGLMLISVFAQSADTFCAKVKIEILQELTLERQGFEATMRISNGLDTFALEDIAVDILFNDSDDNPVVATSDPNASSADFYIRLDDASNISGVAQLEKGSISGGSVAPASEAEIKWLIIPVPGAAKNSPTGKLYFVGAKLRYSYGGKVEELEVTPDTITVKPQPQLTLDYFLTEHVFGDDAFTDLIEPIEPYTLGIRLANNGYGIANNVKLDSAQPRITENDQGLSIGFNIAGSYVNDAPSEPSLLLNFGDIDAGARTMGRWIMETTLSGKFTEFSATVSHAAEFGGELTSLIEGANTHFLVRDVQVDASGRDDVKDFLAHDGNANSLWVYESENLAIENSQCDDCSAVTLLGASLSAANETANGTIHTLTPGSSEDEFAFIKIPDPYQGQKVLSRTLRSDGKTLLEANAWLGKERNSDKITFDYFIYVFDQQVNGTYSLLFNESNTQPQAPLIQFIVDKTTFEGGQVGFLVRASDANGDDTNVTIEAMPLGAEFSYEMAQPLGKGVFSWFPQIGQAGTYPVTFMATDGNLASSHTVTIKVNPANDIDGDGLNDDWEREHFGDLSRDGTGDYDQDGYTDLEEYIKGWNPLEAAKVPNVPTILSPIFDGETYTITPELIIENSRHSSDIIVSYTLEVYGDSAMTERVLLLENIAEDIDQTLFQLSVTDLGEDYQDNHLYFWRVRGVADEGSSEWAIGQFFINTQNDAPDTPLLRSPDDNGIVSSEQPELSVNTVIDVDRDAVSYGFALYAQGADVSTDEALYKIDNLPTADNGVVQWQLPVALQEDTTYLWQVTATDEHGLQSQSQVAMFLMSTQNHAPSAALISAPTVDSEVATLVPVLSWLNAQDPEGLALSYVLQWDNQADFNSDNLVEMLDISELSNGITEYPLSLSDAYDNQWVYWRVKATDGELASDWVQGQFFVNTVNDLPSEPTVANPAQNATVEVLQPILSVNAATDIDGDIIQYRFELFQDPSMSQLVSSALVNDTAWTVPNELTDNQSFYWRVRAEDSHGASSSWSNRHEFFVNNAGINDEPQFNFVLPSHNIELTDGDVVIQWTDSDPDSNAKITLWYEGDNGEVDTIATDLSEDSDGEADRFTWHVSNLPVGNYSIKAVISDEDNRLDVTAAGLVSVIPFEGHVLPTLQTANELDELAENTVRVDVVLDRAPYAGSDVTVNISLSDASEARIIKVEQDGQVKASNYLYFTPENWNKPFSIYLQGQDDCEVDGNVAVDLVLNGVASADSGFNGIDPQDISLINIDNEEAGQTLFVCGLRQLSQSISGDEVTTTFKANLNNAGGDVYGVLAKLSILDTAYTLVEGDQVYFENVAAHSSTESKDTFTLRYNKAVTFNPAKLQWDARVVQEDANKLPTGWKNENVGWLWHKGKVSVSAGTIKVNTSGADIWGLNDSFHFVHRALKGDGEIITQINRLDNSHNWAKAGVMIRESTWSGSKHVSLLMTPKKGVDFQYRASTNWVSKGKGRKGAAMGTWLKLKREGHTFTGYTSNDGISWVKFSEQNVNMSNKVRIGLAVSSHNWFKKTTAEFDSVWVEN